MTASESMPARCPRCQTEIATGIRFCPNCGLDQTSTETYELGGAGGMGLPTSVRGWIILGLIVLAIAVITTIGIVR